VTTDFKWFLSILNHHQENPLHPHSSQETGMLNTGHQNIIITQVLQKYLVYFSVDSSKKTTNKFQKQLSPNKYTLFLVNKRDMRSIECAFNLCSESDCNGFSLKESNRTHSSPRCFASYLRQRSRTLSWPKGQGFNRNWIDKSTSLATNHNNSKNQRLRS
jgi:hypothetical protein